MCRSVGNLSCLLFIKCRPLWLLLLCLCLGAVLFACLFVCLFEMGSLIGMDLKLSGQQAL